jgi:uncharacterized protein YndB with AHSA1/START domain
MTTNTNPSPRPGDSATVSVHVDVDVDDAFAVFTEEIDLWWRTGPAYRIAGKRPGRLCLEPHLGGRLFETFDGKQRTHTLVVGSVTEWDPPRRLALVWRGVNFKPHEQTLVEVGFAAHGDGTLVTVRHSGWSSLPDDHPARHGHVGAAFSRFIGLWWGGLMTALREHVAARRPAE